MARPTKEGLDYFPLDVDAADDPVIKKAIKIFGTDAWAIFTETLSYIYDKKGYYAIYDDLFLFRINDRFGISEQKIADVILYLEQRNVFHIFRLGDDSTVITSEGVQRRYLTVRKKLNRKSSFRINPDIWLLDEIPPEGFLSYGDFSESSEETPEKEGFSGEESAQKKRKRKEEKKIRRHRRKW